MVAKAPPDGYTVGVSNIASHAIAPAMYRTVGYTPGNGTIAHVTVEALRQLTRLAITHVPVRGPTPPP